MEADNITPTQSTAPTAVTSSGGEVSGPRQVQYVAPYKESTWIPIGRENEGVAANGVQYSQGLRLPGHLTSFIKIMSKATKGITNSADNIMVFSVMRGEVLVVINSLQFMATRGDTVFIPAHNSFNMINDGPNEAELFNFQFNVKTPGANQLKVQCALCGPPQAGDKGACQCPVSSTARVFLPGHVTAFFRIRGQVSKGITNTADNTMVFVVIRGEVGVMINSLQFMATRGDTIYIPPNSIYDLINMGRDQAELFNFQYRTKI